MRIWSICLIAVLCQPVFAAGDDGGSRQREGDFIATGDLRTDMLSISCQPLNVLAAEGQEEISRKSPFLAAGLSAVLPGAGEFYSESYWKSALFFAAEVALWTLNTVYNNKGDDQTGVFERYADEHWSPARYAEWINANLQYLNASLDRSDYAVYVNPDASLPPWERIDWAALGRVEREIGNGFSHSLAPHGDQQYYEMIGKYMQFIHGWDETDFNTTTYMDQLTTQMTWYANERGKANNFYNIAGTTATILVLNHVLSAADAAWSAHLKNSIHAEIGIQRIPASQEFDYVPTMKLSVSF